MITVTVKRTYFDATSFATDEHGVLRVCRDGEVIAQYEAGADLTVTQEAPYSLKFAPKLYDADLTAAPGL
jgi:hypothetical protein